MSTTETYRPTFGDVIEDAYGNPAVVIAPGLIVQTCGSDHGRVTSIGRTVRRVDDPAARDWALERARLAWRTVPVIKRVTQKF